MLNKFFRALILTLSFSVTVATATLPTPTVSPAHSLNRIVAVVNEEIITQSEFDHALAVSRQQVAQSGVQMPEEKVFKKQVLDQLIYQKLELQLAKRNNIQASEAEINTAIARIAAQNNITVDVLKQKVQEEGVSFAEFKKNIGQQIILSKLQHQVIGNITVSKAEITAFRAKHANEVSGTKQYHLATILIPLPESPTPAQIAQAKATATAVYNEVRTKKNFSAVMAKYPNSSDLGTHALNDLPQIFVNPASKMRVGEVAAPIQAPNGFHVLKLIGIEQKGGGLTDQQIQMYLYQQKFEQALKPWLEKLKAAAYVKIYITF